ncbi:hypothetical protein FB005_12143 [Sinorhizobium medicae]|nr:hypothetical protein FB006_12241 [Sinorhizobium medicae]TWA37458.1 hypothetical protein FB005_12143 [Sinorhizobium medicae]
MTVALPSWMRSLRTAVCFSSSIAWLPLSLSARLEGETPSVFGDGLHREPSFGNKIGHDICFFS